MLYYYKVIFIFFFISVRLNKFLSMLELQTSLHIFLFSHLQFLLNAITICVILFILLLLGRLFVHRGDFLGIFLCLGFLYLHLMDVSTLVVILPVILKIFVVCTQVVLIIQIYLLEFDWCIKEVFLYSLKISFIKFGFGIIP